MRHKNLGRKLGRRADHRKAMRRNMVSALFTHGRIVTTLAKAKEHRRHAEKLITLAKVKSLHHIRLAARVLGNDRVVIRRLFEVIGPAFVDRPGGYTRILKLAKPRVGDNSPRAILELFGESERRAKEAEERRALEAAKAGKGKKDKGRAKGAKGEPAAEAGADVDATAKPEKGAKPGKGAQPENGAKASEAKPKKPAKRDEDEPDDEK